MTKQGRLMIDVSMAAARQGAGGGDRCLSGGNAQQELRR